VRWVWKWYEHSRFDLSNNKWSVLEEQNDELSDECGRGSDGKGGIEVDDKG